MKSSGRTHGRIAAARASDLTAQEQGHVRTAMRFLRTRTGSWAALAGVLRFKETYLCDVANERANASVSASLAVRIAKLAQVGVDDVLTGRFPDPRACPHCGHVPASAAPSDAKPGVGSCERFPNRADSSGAS